MNKENFSANNFGVQMFEFSDVTKTSQSKIAITKTPATKDPVIKESFKCLVCEIDLNSSVVYEQHIKGQKHLKKAGLASLIPPKAPKTGNGSEEVKEMSCDICNVHVIGQSNLDAHLAGKKHEMKVKNEQKLSDPSAKPNPRRVPPVAPNKTTDEPKPEPARCEICDLSLSTKDQLTIHLAGKKHLKKLSSMSNMVDATKKQKNNNTTGKFKIRCINMLMLKQSSNNLTRK